MSFANLDVHHVSMDRPSFFPHLVALKPTINHPQPTTTNHPPRSKKKGLKDQTGVRSVKNWVKIVKNGIKRVKWGKQLGQKDQKLGENGKNRVKRVKTWSKDSKRGK